MGYLSALIGSCWSLLSCYLGCPCAKELPNSWLSYPKAAGPPEFSTENIQQLQLIALASGDAAPVTTDSLYAALFCNDKPQ